MLICCQRGDLKDVSKREVVHFNEIFQQSLWLTILSQVSFRLLHVDNMRNEDMFQENWILYAKKGNNRSPLKSS